MQCRAYLVVKDYAGAFNDPGSAWEPAAGFSGVFTLSPANVYLVTRVGAELVAVYILLGLFLLSPSN